MMIQLFTRLCVQPFVRPQIFGDHLLIALRTSIYDVIHFYISGQVSAVCGHCDRVSRQDDARVILAAAEIRQVFDYISLNYRICQGSRLTKRDNYFSSCF